MIPKDVVVQLKPSSKSLRETLSSSIARQIRKSIMSGELRSGDRIPSTRKLAAEMKVARGTVTTAIDLLIAEGLLHAKVGAGTYVATDANLVFESSDNTLSLDAPNPRSFPQPDIDQDIEGEIDFRPCRPSLAEFPVTLWRRCMASASSRALTPDYGSPFGDLSLRETLSDYLRRARGLAASADRIFITNGAVHAMHILSALYLDKKSTVVFENPGYPLAQQTFAMAGAKIRYCRVDTEGLFVDDLPKSGKSTKFVYVTPSHQFPMGSRLSLGRRYKLIDWAAKNGAMIIEDDYDGEFRYDVPPLAPLAAIAPNAVVYCGTFSKTMFPGLRMGFVVASKKVIDAMATYRTISEYAPNAQIQIALNQFISHGGFEKHVHRMRRVYAQKRRLVASTLRNCDVQSRLSGLDSGLSAIVDVDPNISAEKLAMNALKRGILVTPISRYMMDQSKPRNALVVGYAAPTLQDIEFGLRNTLLEPC